MMCPKYLILVTIAISGAPLWASENGGVDHWAFDPVVRPDVPTTTDPSSIRTPVDAFIQARLRAAGMAPARRAERRTLIRRLTFNLWGLPPTAEQIHAFERDRAPGAYERLIERLLASPHYGERWARHWLDVARFAESSGYVENHNWPHFWRYRDWVVQSFNEDKPYDVFITQQVAGDELEPYADQNVVATGFLAAARLATEELSCVRQENDMYVDMVNATSSALLGITMACAQCHDHMFDPLTQRDYFQLQAFFVRGYPGNLVLGGEQVADELRDLVDQWRERKLAAQSRVLSEGYRGLPDADRALMNTSAGDRTPSEEAIYRVRRAEMNIRIGGCNAFRLTDNEKEALERLQEKLKKLEKDVAQTWGFYSPATSPHQIAVLPMEGNFPLVHERQALAERSCFLLERGDPYRTTERIDPGFPSVLNFGDHDVSNSRPRLSLARWLTDPRNPLTARVWVNRIWAYHFGRGIVATTSNFGTRGAKPSHPDLLDYLASELVESGWSTKHIHRIILKSNTYQQSTQHNPHAATVDPPNAMYWRWPTRRLEAEAIRDALLTVTGKLDRTMGGPSTPPGEATARRSLYLLQRRDEPHDFAQLFDGPTEMSASCAGRLVSTTAVQPLYLLNDPNLVALAGALAEQTQRVAGDDPHRQIEAIYECVLGRAPHDDERQMSLDYLQAEVVESSDNEPRDNKTTSTFTPLEKFAQVMIGLNEFHYLP